MNSSLHLQPLEVSVMKARKVTLTDVAEAAACRARLRLIF